MRILPDQETGIKHPGIQLLDAGKCIQADLDLVPHPVHFYMYNSGRFLHKCTFQVSDHGCENKGKRMWNPTIPKY